MAEPAHILVVEDDPEIRTLLRDGFVGAGYTVSEASNKAALLKKVISEPIDLITLDLELGNEDGLEVAREIRAERNMPIMMITGKIAPDDRVQGLELGADDYVVKPFNMREVLLRTRIVLNRYRGVNSDETANTKASAKRFEFDVGVLDVYKRQLRDRAGKTIGVTDSEFDLLTVLIRNPGRILSRDELSQLIFKRDWSPLERTIDGHIARLRRKIEPESEVPRLIRSVRGVGYVFTGDVREV